MKKRLYLAGELFDFKHLVGNAYLAEALREESDRNYDVILPQDHESSVLRSTDIRDEDIRLLMSCDLAVFNFDGNELDSGTVAEFMIAKFLDIACVVVRTDFRAGGDQMKHKDPSGGDPWNLMLSGYPRVQVVKLNAMKMYHEVKRSVSDSANLTKLLTQKISQPIRDAFNNLSLENPLLREEVQIRTAYSWINVFATHPGPALCEEKKLEELVQRRLQVNQSYSTSS